MSFNVKTALNPREPYYLYCDYKDDYFEWKKRGSKKPVKGANRIHVTALEMIKIRCLVENSELEASIIFELIPWKYGLNLKRNQLNTIILAIKNGKTDYWFKLQKGNKYEDIIKVYGLEYLLLEE